jgi:hypothetical protein
MRFPDIIYTLRTLLFFLAISAVTPPPVLGGTIDPNTPDSKYIEFGKQFPCVVKFVAPTTITITRNEQQIKVTTQMAASAVVIAPHWALTAAHVLADASGMPTLIADSGKEHAVDHAFVHEKFKDTAIGYFDIALCYCPEPFALEFYPALYTKPDEVGKAITIAGYGTTGTFHTGNVRSDKYKRAGHNRIDNTDRGVVVCSPSKHNRFPLEFCITPGDSGGGMFIGNSLAGINSFLMAVDGVPDGTYTDECAFTRISLHADWVRDRIKKYEMQQAPAEPIIDLVLP